MRMEERLDLDLARGTSGVHALSTSRSLSGLLNEIDGGVMERNPGLVWVHMVFFFIIPILRPR